MWGGQLFPKNTYFEPPYCRSTLIVKEPSLKKCDINPHAVVEKSPTTIQMCAPTWECLELNYLTACLLWILSNWFRRAFFHLWVMYNIHVIVKLGFCWITATWWCGGLKGQELTWYYPWTEMKYLFMPSIPFKLKGYLRSFCKLVYSQDIYLLAWHHKSGNCINLVMYTLN